MEFIEIVLMFGGMGLGFAALYEIALWFSPEERDLRKTKKVKQVEAQKFITLPTDKCSLGSQKKAQEDFE